MIHALSNVLSKNIGPNTEVWQFCVILPEAVVGDNCNICSHVFIENKVIIGNNVTIKNGVQIWDGITIEDNVFIGPNVTFTNELIPRSKVYSSSNLSCTLIKKVTKDILPYSFHYGNPATQKGYITEDGILLDMEKRDKNGVEHILNT